VKERLELHNLRTDHVMIRSELKYLIGGKVVVLKCRVFSSKTGPFPMCRVFLVVRPVATVRVRVEPEPDPTSEFGPVANTKPNRQSASFNVIHTFMYNDSDLCQNINMAAGSSPNQPKKHPMSLNNHPYNYQWRQILNRHYIQKSITGASIIFGLIRKVIEY